MDRQQPFDGLSAGAAVAAVEPTRADAGMHPSRVLLVAASHPHLQRRDVRGDVSAAAADRRRPRPLVRPGRAGQGALQRRLGHPPVAGRRHGRALGRVPAAGVRERLGRGRPAGDGRRDDVPGPAGTGDPGRPGRQLPAPVRLHDGRAGLRGRPARHRDRHPELRRRPRQDGGAGAGGTDRAAVRLAGGAAGARDLRDRLLGRRLAAPAVGQAAAVRRRAATPEPAASHEAPSATTTASVAGRVDARAPSIAACRRRSTCSRWSA